jgi:hypothetical protein
VDLDVIGELETPLVRLAVSSRRFLSKSRYTVAPFSLTALPSNYQFIPAVNSDTVPRRLVARSKEAVLIEPPS